MPPRSNHRTLLGRASLLFSFALLASVACGGSTEPKVDDTQPANLVVITAPATSGEVDTPAGQFVVKVTDRAGRGVAGVHVAFSADIQNALGFSPTDTTTDSGGLASTSVRMGLWAESHTAIATARGVAAPATIAIKMLPGPPEGFYVDRTSLRLFGPGDTASFSVIILDRLGNLVPNAPVDFQLSDSSLISLTTATPRGGAAKVRALKGGGTAQIGFVGGSYPGALPVTVFANTRTACTGVAAPQDVRRGVVVTAADSVLCIAESSGAQYALIVYNASMDGSASSGTTVTAYNVVPDFGATLRPSSIPSLSRSSILSGIATQPKLDLRFHEQLLTRSRSLRRLFGSARAARSVARVGALGRIRGPSYALGGSAPSVPAVDSLIALNVATDACTTADMRTFRVEAVGTHAIVLADTANPFGGFSRTDYQRFAARFDTLVYPLDVANFDAPTDIDNNDHVAILFTRAVNELTPPNSGAFVGGFFHPRDLFPRTQSSTLDVCATSNEGEMFYMMVPDPTGVVGNLFRRGYVDTLTTGILAHEFQHLINAGRRMYVNNASDFEETWLNEGLSHEAQELLYFWESGKGPRSGLTAQSFSTSPAQWNTWVADDASNFVNYFLYLSDPANHSPIDPGDELETRGATWSFLRFAVDQSFPSDGGVWQRFTNSTTTGIGTLTFALQRDPKALLRDFAVANSGAALSDPRFRILSWNYPDIFSQVFGGHAYPLTFGRLQEATAMPVAARGGSASYYTFDVPPGVQTLLKFGANQAPPSGNLTFIVLQLRSTP